GVATTIPADLAILRHPDFAAFEHSTKWVENVLDLTGVSSKPAPAVAVVEEGAEPKVRRDVDVEVNAKKFPGAMRVPEWAGAPASSSPHPPGSRHYRRRPTVTRTPGTSVRLQVASVLDRTSE